MTSNIQLEFSFLQLSWLVKNDLVDDTEMVKMV